MFEKKRYFISILLASFLLAGWASDLSANAVHLDNLEKQYYLATEGKRSAVLDAIREEGTPAALQFSLDLLNYPDLKVRMEAVKSIKGWGDKGLRAMFHGMDNPEISWMCESVFVELGSEAVPYILGMLDDPNEYNRARAAYLLGIIKDRLAIGPLYDHLKDPSREVRMQVIQALTDLGDENALGYILELFDTEDVGLADFVLMAAQKFGWRAARVLEASMESKNEKVRSGAAMALGRIRVPESIPLLVKGLSDPSPTVRRNVVSALGNFQSMNVVDTLITAMGDKDMQVQEFAGDALARLGSDVVPILIEHLTSPNALIRKNIVSSLRKIGDKRAIVPIINLLEDPDPTVRMFAVSALMEFKDPRAIRPLIYRLANEEKIHWLVSFAFMQMGNEAVDELLQATGDEEFCYTRNLIILRMGEKALDVLHLRARTGSSNVRMNAIVILGELGYPQSLPVLSALLADEKVGWVAAHSLADIGKNAWKTLYEDAHGEALMRKNALDGISMIKDQKALPDLLDCLADDDAGIRRAISKSLVRAGADAIPLIIEKMLTLDGPKFADAAEILCRMNDARAQEKITQALFPKPWAAVALEKDRLFRFRYIYARQGSIVAVRDRVNNEISGSSGGGEWQRVAQ